MVLSQVSHTAAVLHTYCHGPVIIVLKSDDYVMSSNSRALVVGENMQRRCIKHTEWPNKNRTFLRYHIFAATTDIIMRFLLKCSEITAENNTLKFFKQVLNIPCKVTRNGLRHTRLLDDDQPGLD